MKLEQIIKEELKTNISEKRKDPKFKDPKINLINEPIVTIADCIRIAEKFASLNTSLKEWTPVHKEPKDVGFFLVFNNYVNVRFPVDRAYWDGTCFRPINDNGLILSNQNFISITHYTEALPYPVIEEIGDN